MLRLALVHAPQEVGGNPGMEIDDVTRFLGPLVGDSGADGRAITNTPPKDAGEKEPISKKKKDIGGVKEIKGPRKACVAVDFDKTLTLDPRWFARQISKLAKVGIECHLVTGRPQNESAHVEAVCKRYGVRFASISYYPLPYEFDWVKWDSLLDSRVGSWKGGRIAELGAFAAIDDNPIHISGIVRRLPNIIILTPIGGR